MNTAFRAATRPVGECHPRQPVGVDDEPDDFAVYDANPARIELRPFSRGHAGRVREEHNIIGPLPDELKSNGVERWKGHNRCGGCVLVGAS